MTGVGVLAARKLFSVVVVLVAAEIAKFPACALSIGHIAGVEIVVLKLGQSRRVLGTGLLHPLNEGERRTRLVGLGEDYSG